MPHPLRKRVSLDFMVNTLAEKHELCAKLTKVVAMSSLLETRLSGLLAMLSGASPEVTVAMFLAVNSTDAQRAMLRSAAEVTLKGQELEALTDLLDDYRPRAKERNKIVHGVWATAPEVEDGLILVQQSDMAAFNRTLASLSLHNPLGDGPDIMEHVLPNCMVYRARDFDDVFARLAAYDDQIIQFWKNLVDARVEAATSAVQGALPLQNPDQDLHQEEG